MEIRTLYAYERKNGKITVSPEKPDIPYEELYRVIAGEGKLVTLDGENTYAVIDTDVKDGWHEVDAPKELEELEELLD